MLRVRASGVIMGPCRVRRLDLTQYAPTTAIRPSPAIGAVAIAKAGATG
jgi:hypothetical protein